jgi:hypothetical protein
VLAVLAYQDKGLLVVVVKHFAVVAVAVALQLEQLQLATQ